MSVTINRGKALDSLNLTPLIDVVFLLLVFFLVASRFAQADRELPVKLPSATSALPMTMEPNEIVVNISQEGNLVVNGEQMTISQLETIIVDAMTQNPLTQSVIIRGDRRVDFQSVVNVLDLCNRLGVPSYKLTTDGDTASS